MGLIKNKILGIEERKRSRTPICVLVEEPGKNQEYFDKSVDLSEDGIFILTDTPRQKGEEVTLRMALPGTMPFVVSGRVTRVAQKGKVFGRQKSTGMGIQFTKVDPQSMKMIKEFVRP